MADDHRSVLADWAACAPDLELWRDGPSSGDWAPVYRGAIVHPPIAAGEGPLEIVRRGAEGLREQFEASGMRHGFLSASVDPRHWFDEERMFGQGMAIARVAQNAMPAVPATAAGLRVLRRLTERGIPTRVTAAFTASQLMACARVVQDAEAVGRKRGHDFSRWRNVLEFMPGRMEELGSLEAEGKAAFADWSDDDRHWAGVAVAKRTRDLLNTGGYPSRLLLSSIRTGPGDRCVHVDETCGADQMVAVGPDLLDWLTKRPPVPWRHSMVEPVPEAVMRRLLALPYFSEVYVDGAQAPDRFDTFVPVVRTCADYVKATDEPGSFAAGAI